MKTNKQMMEVEQAHWNGGKVKRTCHKDKTFVVHLKAGAYIRWNWADYDYDIVEEPIVRYMVTTQHGGAISTYPVYAAAKKVLKDLPSEYKIIKLVQDMDFEGE